MARNAKNTRMCAGCMLRKRHNELIRIVYNSDKIFFIGSTNESSGRSVYVCPDLPCFEKAVKRKAFNRSFKCDIPANIYEDIRNYIDVLKQE